MDPKAMLIFIILFPLAGAFIGYAIGRKGEKWRDIFNVFMTGITLLGVVSLFPYIRQGSIEVSIPNIMGTGLHLILNAFRYIFVFLTAFVWFLTTIYSNEYLVKYKNRNRYYLFFMLTLWSTIGMFVSENFINLFTFFEIMSLTSYALVIHDENEYSHEAGNTYIVMAVTGGLILLMGLFLLYDYTNTLDIMELQEAVKDIGNIKYFIVLLISIGFGIKAGMFPLHIWLPKAHPAAPAPASAILSGILLKTGIFGILVTIEIIMKEDLIVATIILILGFINMFMGGFLAMFQRNIKRVLAYSSMSQIGYILVGIGLAGMLKDHGAIAIYGALYHIINHAIFKVLLFMIAGIVYISLHQLSINKMGGFGRDKKLLKVLFLIGVFAITGMPGFNGFTSKSLLHHALAEAHHIYGGFGFTLAEIIFTLSSSFTVAYMAKIFIAIFVEKSERLAVSDKEDISFRAIIPMVILGISIVYIGIRPSTLMGILDGAIISFGLKPSDVHFYTFTDFKSSFISIALGLMIYIYFIRRYTRTGSGESWYYKNIALNWFSIEKNIYKPIGKILFNISSFLLRAIDQGLVMGVILLGRGLRFIGNIKFKRSAEISKSFERLKLSVNDEYVRCGNVIQETEFDGESFKNVNEKLGELSLIFNSITYSVFLFGAVLVICLVIMIS